MAAVEGQAVALADGVVPVALEGVDVVGDEARSVGFLVVVGGGRVQWFLVVVLVVLGGRCW